MIILLTGLLFHYNNYYTEEISQFFATHLELPPCLLDSHFSNSPFYNGPPTPLCSVGTVNLSQRVSSYGIYD